MMRKHLGKVLYLAACLACVGMVMPAAAQLWIWSTTASTNATVDATINFAEGQPPSSLNDSSRAAMARLAQFRNDISGQQLDTGSTGSAYTVASSSGSAATPQSGQEFSFTPAHTNAFGVTLAVDGGTAFPIQSPLGTAIPAGLMLASVPYTVVFNTGGSAWVLKNVQGSGTVYLGADFTFANSTTLTNVTGFAFNVLAGNTYAVEVQGMLTNVDTGVASGFQDTLVCTCTASNVLYDSWTLDWSAFAIEGGPGGTSFGTAQINRNMSTNTVHVELKGSFTVSVSGIVQFQVAQSTSSAAVTTLKKGSWMRVWQ